LKKILVLVFAGLALFALCACAPKSNTDNKDKDSGTATPQTKKDVTIAVTPPSGWNAVSGTVLPAQYQKGTASFMAKTEAFSGTSLDSVAEQAKQAFSGAFEEVKYLGEPEKITVGGKEAVRFFFTCKVSGMSMKFEYVYLFAGGKVWAITFGDLADTFDSLQGDYDAILQGIQFK